MGGRQKAWRRRIPSGARPIVDAAVELALMEPLPGMADRRMDALRRAFALDVPATLPRLAPLVFAPQEEVAGLAEVETERLIATMKSWEFAALDRELRLWASPLRDVVGMVDLTRAVRRSSRQPLLLGLASCHPDGRVRATAMHTAEQWDVDLPLPFTLVRLDDWVQPVRRLARGRVLQRLGLEHVPQLVAALPLMEALAARRRVARDKTLRWVEQLLRDPAARSSLWEGLASDETAVRRSCVELLAESDDVDLVRMLEVACSDPDPVIAGRAADAVLAGVTGVPDALLASPNAPVRARALLRAATLPPAESLGPLQAALLDPRRSVREIAVHHLREGGAEGIAARYKAVIARADGERRRAAIAGLGETGEPGDGEVLLPFLELEVPPGTSRAAVSALARLDTRGRSALFVDLLDDPRRGVSREATRALLSPRAVVPEPRLWELVTEAKTAHGSRNAFRIVARGGRWRRVARMLVGADSTDPWIAQQALAGLERWCGASIAYGQVPASKTDAALVDAALKGRGRGVPERIARVVATTLDLART